MSEENVVRPDFGKRNTTAVPVASAAPPEPPREEISDHFRHIGPLTGEALVRAQKDLLYMIANASFVHQMKNKLTEAGNTIFALRSFAPDQESIRLRRQGLKSYSLDDICKVANNTHQLQWRTQPSFLGALTLEHHCRVQAALSVMPVDEPKGK